MVPYSSHGLKPPFNSSFYVEPGTTMNISITYTQPVQTGTAMSSMIARKLHELASTGEIMVATDELEKLLLEPAASKHVKKPSFDFAQGLQEAEEKDLVIVTKRQFGNKPSQKFASLKLKGVSLESVMWILRSLEKDEMTPVERAVQSRFKESFGLKMCTAEWAKVLEALRSPKTVSRDKDKDPEYDFDILEIDDTVSGCKTCCIYPKGKTMIKDHRVGHKWTAIDMNLKPGEINQELFKEFYAFLEGYFLGTEEDDKEKAKGEERCIPGGRYGCAQFVKACGTPRLKACSLGQLAQFIQFAINEDVLRYQRTLLIWNKNPMKQKKHEISSSDSEAVRKQKERMAQKLNITRQAIIEVLTENPAGLSLAQLPLHLKYKLPFPLDLNELGFVKLKELLITMTDQVKIELRGHNHPFARLAHKPSMGAGYGRVRPFDSDDFGTPDAKCHTPQYSDDFNYVLGAPAIRMPPVATPRPFIDFNKQLDMIRNCIYILLQEFPPGIDSTKLPLLLYMRLGLPFDWFVFGCSTLLEFLQKYISPYYELEFIAINPYDSNHFVLRHKEAYRNYTNMAGGYYNQYSSEYYPVHYRFETDPNVLSSLPGSYGSGSSVPMQSHSVQPSQYIYPGPTAKKEKSMAGESVAGSISGPESAAGTTSFSPCVSPANHVLAAAPAAGHLTCTLRQGTRIFF